MVTKSGSIWSEENYGGKEYDRLENFPPKMLLDDSIANRPTMRSSSAIRASRTSLVPPFSNSIGERSKNSCFHRDSTESLIPYSQLAADILFPSVKISSTIRALYSGVNFLHLTIFWTSILQSNSDFVSCPVFGVHYKPRQL